MRLRLFLGLAVLAASTPAPAESWKPVPNEPDTYYDTDFLKVDAQSGLVLLRSAVGKPGGAGYAEWTDKTPIIVSAIDCQGDAYKDLGLDFEGDADLPEGWRKRRSQAGIKFGVGGAAVVACKVRETLPKVALP
jgi:hypothetical protein